MKFTPHTPEEITGMLAEIGIASLDALFAPIPDDLKARPLELPAGVSEMEALASLRRLAGRNRADALCFLGGGVYDHFIPSAVDALSSRPEFYTAYTPYQPEASQGTLQVLYEYQTMMCELTGLDASNASMYDGGTALAEAALMMVRIGKKKNRIVIDASVNPQHREIVRTYLQFLEVEVIELEESGAVTPWLDGQSSGFLFQNPAWDGSIRDFSPVVARIHADKSVAALSCYPIALALLQSPAEMGFDIAVGDGQSLGNPLSFGGPYFGFMTCSDKYIRNLPGRIVGKTIDRNGKSGYVLTLQAREQHIKRQKATSNICSNQSLCAMNGLFYLSLLGQQGLQDVAHSCLSKTEYAKSRLSTIPDVELVNNEPTFNEFVLRLPRPAIEVGRLLAGQGILAGVPLSLYDPRRTHELLVAVTEKRTRADIDTFVEKLEAALCR